MEWTRLLGHVIGLANEVLTAFYVHRFGSHIDILSTNEFAFTFMR